MSWALNQACLGIQVRPYSAGGPKTQKNRFKVVACDLASPEQTVGEQGNQPQVLPAGGTASRVPRYVNTGGRAGGQAPGAAEVVGRPPWH